jgi:hypothetical protein
MFNLDDNYEIIKVNSIDVVNNIQNTDIRPSIVHGNGLFALIDIKEDTTLTYLTGQILPNEFVKKHETPTREWNAIHEHFFLYRYARTKYSFINHSRDNYNCEVSFSYPIVSLIATKTIKIGDELLLDYRKEALPDWYTEGHGATYL